MRSPSSLIFLALIGVWAAYFVQYWIRRRDHLATARSVEQFSAALRVLERRTPIPRTDLSDPAPRSWSVHPARSVRPQVVVKRAVPADPVAPRLTDDGARPLSGSVPAQRGPRPLTAPLVRPARRVRALVLLLALLGSLVTVGLVGLARVPGWAPLVGVAAVVASFLWVRSAVRAEQAARVAARRRAAAEVRRRASAPVRAARPGRPARASRPAAASERHGEPVADAPAAAAPARPASDPLEVALAVDASSATAPATAAVAQPDVAAEPTVVPGVLVEPEPEPVLEYVHLVDEDDIPLTWDPVPVPRPTYTMKAKAERPEVPPAEVTPDPVRTELPSRGEVDERRAAGA